MPRRFLIAAAARRVPENTVARGFFWLAKSINILVIHAYILCNAWVADGNFQDFLSVRKIPVKSHERLREHGIAPTSNSEPEAQTVSAYLDTIRKYLLQDRALHDMVLLTFFTLSSTFHLITINHRQ
jgi:hypothetical protein